MKGIAVSEVPVRHIGHHRGEIRILSSPSTGVILMIFEGGNT